MNWKSEERKAMFRNSATDPWDIAVLDLAEDIGNWLEAGLEWRAFDKIVGYESDQVGCALVVVLSEWHGFGFWELLSPIEQMFVGPYVLTYNEMAQENAANQSHIGEADETLVDLDK